MQQRMTNLEKIGGIEVLRQIMNDFYQRIFNDDMIAYLFQGQDITRLVEREVEWTARLFGDKQIVYQGKPLQKAHSKHPIRRGHFFRRHQLLIDTLDQYSIADEIKEMWIKHSLSLVNVILGQAKYDTRCEMTSQQDAKTSTASSGLWISTDKR